jgi:hypothetical protein
MKTQARMHFFSFCSGLLLLCGVPVFAAQGTPEANQFFKEQVHPLLKAHCIKCHGGEKTKGGFMLTTRDSLLKGGDNGAAVDTATPAKSRLLEMLSYRDADHEMPPAGKRPQAEIDIIRKWLEMGAPYDPSLEQTPGAPAHVQASTALEDRADWWAYKPVRADAPPQVADPTWQKNPVDAFLAKQHSQKNLRPNPPASKEQLIRRAYYDLTGLPPSPEEVAGFVADASPDAWPRLVDSLLAKPQYGEKWARHWMDVIRYAESEGFERDNEKPHIWRYRDYLIQAFNSDLPYNRFIVEQLAGDELEQPTQQSLTATGFLRLMQWDDEPSDRLQAKYDLLADNVLVTSEAFLGMTMGCARCHDHKKDPISQKDYYSFMAFFHGLKDYGATRNNPRMWVPEVDRERLNREQTQRLASMDTKYQRQRDILLEWHAKAAPAGAPPRSTNTLVAPRGGEENAWLHTTRAPASNWHAESFAPTGWSTADTTGTEKGSTIWMRAKFGLAEIPADFYLDLQYQTDTEVFLNGTPILQGRNLPKGRRSLELAPQFKRLLHTGANILTVRTVATEADALPTVSLHAGLSPIAQAEKLLRGPKKADQSELNRLAGGDLLDSLKNATSVWLAEAARPIGTPISAAAEDGVAPAPLAIHRRGNPQNLGDPVEPAYPVVLRKAGPVQPSSAPRGVKTSSGRRLALANWLTQPENPLVSRVAVNRIWQHHFGRGLVPTPNDFGRLGEPPTHPELLDYLARTFIEKGWSFKAMHRLLLTSQAYQMSSQGTQDSLQKDPENLLFWRFPMRRLTAEELRDSILSVSGVLIPQMFGPPVHPPLPRAVLETQSVPGRNWPVESEQDSARRSIYVHVKRTLSVPLLADHDQAPTDTPCAVRFVSTVSTQALGLLNSEFMEKQSKLFAERLRREAGDETVAQIRHGLRLVLQRPPRDEEVALCLKTCERLKSELHLSDNTALQRFALISLNLNEFIYLD